MGSDYDGMVIRPPIERISSGRIFRPSSKLRNKYWFETIVTAFLFWIVTIGTFFGLIYAIYSLGGDGAQAQSWFQWMWGPVNTWFWVANLAWLIPALILIPIYINSFEYSVRAESGEASAEVYVKKGIITKTEKHVPLRSITNVATKIGVLDRVFGIGCVEIETAGFSGAYQEGPEEKISGITFFNELRDYILAEMRKFRGPNVLGTEGETVFEDPVPRISGSRDDEILHTLQEMKDLLRSIDRKLDKER
ncbi:MAG: PH domain-containing protein [Candidatus Thorarchaeota archaeon]